MNLEKLKDTQYSIYSNVIDIELFNKIVTFMAATNTKKEAWDIFNKIQQKCIWLFKTENDAIKKQYEFKYLGELLERYKERIGDDIKVIRAIALAIGYGSSLIEGNMIVDTQLTNFISKIKNLAQNDIYLKGALYLYDNEKYYYYAEELINMDYKKTEEIIFAMSVFYDRAEEFFIKNKNIIIELIGKSKTINAIGNAGVYAWFIRNIYSLIEKDRKKDISLLKALIKIPTEIIIDEIRASKNENKSYYQELTENGYSKEEIVFLNYILLFFYTVPKRIFLGKSVIEERIATNFCKILINSNTTYTNDVYDLISNTLLKYNKYFIKCYGKYSILDVLDKELNVVNPVTFAILFYYLQNKTFSFNILDSKWDIVVQKTTEDEYQEIFDHFLLERNLDEKNIKVCIERYEELTHKNYIKSFTEINYGRDNIFKLLVDNNVIILKEVYEDMAKNRFNNHIRNYIKNINNKKSFEFLKYLLRINKYTMQEINSLGFGFDNLFNTSCYSSRYEVYGLNLKRKFLNRKDQILLFNCLDKYIFYCRPEYYFGFLEQVLEDDDVIKWLGINRLKPIYLYLCQVFPEKFNKKHFQKRFYSEDEYNEICLKEKIQGELEEQRRIKEIEESIKNVFKDVNDLKSLYCVCNKYRFNSDKMPICINLAKEFILKNASQLILGMDQEEINAFIGTLNIFVTERALLPEEFIRITYEYIKGEVARVEK